MKRNPQNTGQGIRQMKTKHKQKKTNLYYKQAKTGKAGVNG
jgi:hypothetical protein